jgi:hypothetical protein
MLTPSGAAVSDQGSENSRPKSGSNGGRNRGRFAPGTSGNPAGKPKGTRNRTSLLFQNRIDARGTEIVDTIIRQALAGDAMLLKALLAILVPARRERVSLNLESIKSLEDAVKASAQIVGGLSDGTLTSGEGAIMNDALRRHIELLALSNIEERLKLLERGRSH